jgi:putative endonuclease
METLSMAAGEPNYRRKIPHGGTAPTILCVHFVYIVRCADGTLYTGYARDPLQRQHAHNSGRGARYTAGRRPVCLVYAEAFESLGDALRRERQVKGWHRQRKEDLIGNSPFRLAAPSRTS